MCAAWAYAGVACTPLPTEPLAENLDPRTGTTVAVAGKPLELVSDKQRGTARDPFAYVGPFETNRQGDKHLYVWIAAPQDKGEILEPTLYCDQQTLKLEPLKAGITDLGLSRQPYPKPAPWSAQWFYHLTEDSLSCLAEAKRIQLVTERKDGKRIQEIFSAEGEEIAPIAAFATSR